MYITSKLICIKILTILFFITYFQSSEAQPIFENSSPSIISLDNSFNGKKDNDRMIIENTLQSTETMTKKKSNNFHIQSDGINSDITEKTSHTEEIKSQSHVLTLGRLDMSKETTHSGIRTKDGNVEKVVYSSTSSIIGNIINLGVGNDYDDKPNIVPIGVWTFDCQNNVDYETDPDISAHTSFSISSNDPDDGKISFNYIFPRFTSTGEVDQGIVVTATGIGNDEGESCSSRIEKIIDMYVPTLAEESTGIDYNLDDFGNIISKDTHHFFKEEIDPLYNELVSYDEDLTWDLKIPPGDRPPIVSSVAIPNPVKPGEPFTLDGSASHDPDEGDSITGYKWEQAVPPGGIVGTSPTVEITAPNVDEETTYTYFLYANDTHNVIGKGGVNVIIRPENTPPIADAIAIPNPVKPGEPFTLDGSASHDPDEGDHIVSYTWDQIIPDGGTISSSRFPTVGLTAPDVKEETTLTYQLTVEDTHQATNSISVSVFVLPNTPPVAVPNASPNPVKSGHTITLDGSASYDPDEGDYIDSYAWYSPEDIVIGQSSIVTITAPNVDEETIFPYRLGISDNHGGVTVTIINVSVKPNTPPVAVPTASPNPVAPGQTITLDGSASYDPDPEDQIISYLWELISPGGATLGSLPVTQFTAPNVDEDTTYQFQLTVSDNHGKKSSSTIEVDIKICLENSLNAQHVESCGNKAPIAVLKQTPSKIATVGSLALLDGIESFDPDKDKIIDYLWKQTDNTKFRVDFPSTISSIITFKVPQKVPATYVSENSLPKIMPLQFSLDVLDEHSLKNKIPANSELLISCSSDEEKRASEVNQIVSNIIENEKDLGYEEAPYRLQHWRAGSGMDLPLDDDWLSKSDDIKKGVQGLHQLYETNPGKKFSGKSLLSFAKSLKSGETKSFSDKWAYAIKTPNYLSDYGASIGSAQIDSSGVFTVSRMGNNIVSISGYVSYALNDIFNFNEGETFFIPASPIRIKADDLNLLEKCRGADTFWQGLIWNQNVIYNGPIDQMHNQYNWQWTPSKWNFPF